MDGTAAMDAMRYSVLPKHTKALDFSRTASDNNILHTSGRKNNKYISSVSCLTYADNKQNSHVKGNGDYHANNEKNKAGSDSDITDRTGIPPPKNYRKQYVLVKNSVSPYGVEKLSNITPYRNVTNNAFEIEVKGETVTDHATKSNNVESNMVLNEAQRDNDSNKPNIKRISVLSHKDQDSESNLSDVTDEELEKLPDLDYSHKSSRYMRSLDASGVLASPSSNTEYNGISDTGTELRKSPTGAILENKNNDLNINEGKNNSPRQTVVNKHKRIHLLKRSISSIESDEEFTSFFGSIRNKNIQKDIDDFDEESNHELYYFSSCMPVTSKCPYPPRRESGLKINRSYSAESFMKRRESDDVINSDYSRKSSMKTSSLGDVYDDTQGNGTDRLQIRRGALAEPEKMLISQELRERTQRGIEKRKTFMRKVSQFFNLHLRLNMEEDLI